MKRIIKTSAAPTAIGPYSQAIKAGNTVYLSGQVGLDPATMNLISEDFAAQAEQVFKNIQAVTITAGATLNDIVKLTVYLTDLNNFAKLNEVMAKYLPEPYPARTTIEVPALPKNASIEIDAIIYI